MVKDTPVHDVILGKSAAISLLLVVGISLSNSHDIKQLDNMNDFSGKWVLNLSKSKSFLTEVTSTSPLVITISQDKNSVTLLRNNTVNEGKSIIRTEKYIFNESIERINTEGDKSTVINCSPADDGQSFTITEKSQGVYNGVVGESKRVSVYTLSKDGRNLIIEIDNTPHHGSITPEDEKHEIRVFDKEF
ncbi:MAG: hypothetical protein HZB98_13475 [Bacteroidia bacterium]|nr:hypothetical protein [Bacteroidia bacterium]